MPLHFSPATHPPSPAAALIFLDRYEAASTRGGTQRAEGTVLIRSDTLLTKPLVLGVGVTVQVAAGATLTLAAQPVLPRQQVGGCRARRRAVSL